MTDSPRVGDRIRLAMALPAVGLAAAFGVLIHEVQSNQNQTSGKTAPSGTDDSGYAPDDQTQTAPFAGNQQFSGRQQFNGGQQFSGGQQFNQGNQGFSQLGPGNGGPGMGGTSGS